MFELDVMSRRAVAHALGEGLVAILGAPGTGKSHALLLRALRAAETLEPSARVLLGAAAERGVARFRDQAGDHGRIHCALISDVAFEALRTQGDWQEPTLIDDVRAELLFARAGAQLFSLEWTEFVTAGIDPEITGMRAPQRFAAAAFRLIRKLRAAQISPEEFRSLSLRGATAFYGKPPNLATSDLIFDTPAQHRDSLRVDARELERQHAREVDLVKILERLYVSYLELLVARGCLTRLDALAEATRLLCERPGLRANVLSAYPCAFVDDAQDLVTSELLFLRALYGEPLAAVTLAGDPAQATQTFAGARGDKALESAPTRFVLDTQHRVPSGIAAVAARAIAASVAAEPGPVVVELYRGATHDDEAEFVADTVAALIAAGTAPAQIAVIARSLRCSDVYVSALLARNVPIALSGDVRLFDVPAVQDALAALWFLADPYRHEWVLRSLEAPWMRLSDASIAVLCGEAGDSQALLFELPEEPLEAGRKRWDRRRDLRLGRNVTRGDRDPDLTPAARERLGALRAARERWTLLERVTDAASLARTICADTVLATAGTGARARHTRAMVAHLLSAADAFVRRDPLASLRDFLEFVEETREVSPEFHDVETPDDSAVHVRSVEAAKGREFAHVFVVNVRAGAFPRYYAPDAFLFTRRLGMIAKENVGDEARAARTAKFTYGLVRNKTRQNYNGEERRAFYCAATRARVRLYVSAPGHTTRGVTAPEILEELRAAGLPSARDVTVGWRPTRTRLPNS